MNQLYNLEQTFRTVREILQVNHFFKIYKEFEQEIGLYKKELRNFQKDIPIYDLYARDPSVLWHLGIKDYFEIDITTGFADDSYQLLWNIDKVKEYISKQRIKAQDIPVNFEQIHHKEDHLKDSKLNGLRSLDSFNEPIILASIPAINKFIIIDGNHRFHIAKAQKHHSIKAILLPLSVHIDFICFDSSKICLKVHHNISLLLSLCLSPKKPLTSINKNLGIHDYYPITGNELNFSSLKNNLLSLRQKLSVIPLFS